MLYSSFNYRMDSGLDDSVLHDHEAMKDDLTECQDTALLRRN